MELENPSSSPATITDEQRLLAQTKKVTIQPMNPFLKRDDAPDAITINETHRNIGKDTENTAEDTSLVQPSAGIMRKAGNSTKRHGMAIALILTSVIVGVTVGAAFFLLTTR